MTIWFKDTSAFVSSTNCLRKSAFSFLTYPRKQWIYIYIYYIIENCFKKPDHSISEILKLQNLHTFGKALQLTISSAFFVNLIWIDTPQKINIDWGKYIDGSSSSSKALVWAARTVLKAVRKAFREASISVSSLGPAELEGAKVLFGNDGNYVKAKVGTLSPGESQ